VRAAGATDGPGRHFHHEPFHDRRGLVRWNGLDYRATFVAGDIRLVAADLDDQAAAAVYVCYILVRNDREVWTIVRHITIIVWFRPAFGSVIAW